MLNPLMPRVTHLTKSHLMALICWSAAVAVSAMFLWVVGDLLWHGLSGINLEFITTSPRDSGRQGGIASIIISTLLLLLVCLSVCLPIGLGSAALLAEFTRDDSPFGRLVRRSLDVLAGVPSIVFGLFGSVFFCNILGLGFSILAGGLTLACMVLPIFIRTTEQGLRAVPHEYRLAGAALGLTRATVLVRILFPAATPALIVGLILGIGRAVAESAALIFTSGYVTRMPESVFDSGRALAVHIYDLAMNVTGGETNAYVSALVLVALLMVINNIASGLTQRLLHKDVAS